MAEEPKQQITIQERNEDKIYKKKFAKQRKEFRHYLELMKNGEDGEKLWAEHDNKFLREFVEFIEIHRKEYPCRMGDEPTDTDTYKGMATLTTNFIAAVAKPRNIPEAPPVLQVVVKETVRKHSYGKADPTFKCIKLRLANGDGNVVAGRLNTNGTDYGRKIKEGDALCLDIYTAVSFHETDDSPPKPGLFIAKFSHLGYCKVPEELADPITMASDTTSGESSEDDRNIPIKDIVCNDQARLCSLYGTEFHTCICNCMPPSDVDLEQVSEDCHFVTKEYRKFENKDRRFVLYWYYATNVYTIRGKGNRRYLPDCLVRDIRKLYPSKDGKYTTGYKGATAEYVPTSGGSKAGRKRKHQKVDN